MTTKTKRRSKGPKQLPSRLELLDRFEYDPVTGIIRNRKRKKPITNTSNGYLCVYINRQRFLAHRIIYKMYYGRDPGSKHIDHCNGDRSDNRISNLRCVSAKVNQANTPKAREDGIPQELFVPVSAPEEFQAANLLASLPTY